MKLFLLFLFQLIFLVNQVISKWDPSIPIKSIVQTTNGKLKGRSIETENGNQGYGFFNIPYAQPPLGKLRFQKYVIQNSNVFQSISKKFLMKYQTPLITKYNPLASSEGCSILWTLLLCSQPLEEKGESNI